MSKLMLHLEQMQDMAANYLSPEPYVSHDNVTAYTNQSQMRAFTQDIIRMLDGPEQREAVFDAVENESKLTVLTDNILQWAKDRNLIEGSNPKSQFTKTVEEIGELAGGIARNNTDTIKDSIGDAYVTLVILAAQYDLTMSECIHSAWEEIKDRKGRMVDGVFVKEGDE